MKPGGRLLLASALWVAAAWPLAGVAPYHLVWAVASFVLALAVPSVGFVMLLLAIPFGPEIMLRSMATGASNLLAIRSRLALSVSLYDFIALGLFIRLLVDAMTHMNVRVVRHPLIMLFLSFFFLALFSILCTPDLYDAQKGLACLYLLKWLELAAVFFMGYAFLCRHPEWLPDVALALYATGLLLGLLPWMHAVFPETPRFFYTRLGYAGMLLMVFCVAYRHFFLRPQSRFAWVGFTAFVILLLYGLVHNYKRTSYAGLAVGIAIIGLLVRNHRYVLHVALCVLAVILIHPAPIVQTFRQLANTDEVVSIERAYLQTAPNENPTVTELVALHAQGGSVRERVIIPDVPAAARDAILGLPVYVSVVHRLLGWVASGTKFLQRPLLGHGFWSEWFSDTPTSHNFYLQLLVETGAVGLSLYLIVFARLGWTLLRVSQASQNGLLVALSGGLLSAFGAFLVEGFGASIFYVFQLMMSFWLLAGVVMAFERRQPSFSEMKG